MQCGPTEKDVQNTPLRAAWREGLCYGPGPVRPRSGRRRLLTAAAVAGALIAGILPALGGAQSAPALRAEADALRARRAALEARSHEALLQLYAAESALVRARREVELLRSRLDRVAAEEASARHQALVVERSLAASHARVAATLKALYIEGTTDPIAVLLGATSLEEAVEGIEGLSRAAAHNRRLARDARELSEELVVTRRMLAGRRAALAAAEAEAAAGAQVLELRAAERSSTLASLRAQGDLTERQIASLEARASAAEQMSARVTTPPTGGATSTTASESPSIAPHETEPEFERESALPEPGGTRPLVVDAVAYHLPGNTASGLPVGPGIIAVDPRVIPLGTRVYVPGYGDAIAADTGTAIIGNIIDLWMPSTAEALAWGRRTVTITIYG
jgi:3D (Asp-Asp-Asp) domain-containing protein